MMANYDVSQNAGRIYESYVDHKAKMEECSLTQVTVNQHKVHSKKHSPLRGDLSWNHYTKINFIVFRETQRFVCLLHCYYNII